jgi:hypothetical protein
LLEQDTIEALALAHHDAYRREMSHRGTPVRDPEAMLSWERVSERVREKNRRAARDIGHKLSAVGCRLAPVRDWRCPLLVFTDAEVDRLARMEHERWLCERTANPEPADGPRTSLKAWDDLSETDRETNRNTVRRLPAFLALVGFQIARQEGRTE